MLEINVFSQFFQSTVSHQCCLCVGWQVTHTEETLANNTWSLMLKEVLCSLLKAPEGSFSGLTLLSELLPLPLPMQSTRVPQSFLLVATCR